MTNPITIGDKTFIEQLMRRFNIGKLFIAYSESKKKFPDIWITLGDIAKITVTKEWQRQSPRERRSRLVHEILGHLVMGLEHGKYGKYTFDTHPESDTFSKAMYEQLKKK
jgi:hypothetical protein